MNRFMTAGRSETEADAAALEAAKAFQAKLVEEGAYSEPTKHLNAPVAAAPPCPSSTPC